VGLRDGIVNSEFLHDRFSSGALAFNTLTEEIYYTEKEGCLGQAVHDMGDFIDLVNPEVTAGCKSSPPEQTP
jgi:hypothetical protein